MGDSVGGHGPLFPAWVGDSLVVRSCGNGCPPFRMRSDVFSMRVRSAMVISGVTVLRSSISVFSRSRFMVNEGVMPSSSFSMFGALVLLRWALAMILAFAPSGRS